jgi:phosphonate transport system substrate-binding protein
MSTRRLFLVALFALLLPSLASAQQKVSVGFTAASPEAAEAEFKGLFAHLRASKEVAFDIKVFPSYDALYSAFKQKQLDLALVGAVKYAQAHFETGAVPIIAEGGLVRSMIIVPKASKLASGKELKAKRFGFGYKDSTSTHLMPLLLLSKHSIREADLAKAEFLGVDQQKIVDALVAGKVDAAAVVESVYKQHASKVRVLEQSDPFPGSPLVAQKGMAPATVEAVRRAFLGYKGGGGGSRFGQGSTKVDDSSFNQIRFLVKVLYGKMYV